VKVKGRIQYARTLFRWSELHTPWLRPICGVKGRMQFALAPKYFLSLGRIAYALVTPYMWCKKANAIRPCAEIFFIVGAYRIRPGYALHVV